VHDGRLGVVWIEVDHDRPIDVALVDVLLHHRTVVLGVLDDVERR
jgi:hypothetical protein